MKKPDLIYEVKDKAAWITINRESRRNALTPEMIDPFYDCFGRAESDDDVRVVCLTASGDKAFCSGLDLASGGGGQDHVHAGRRYVRLLKHMAEFPKPLVARVNGHCLAGGMGLMLSCDIVYAKDEAKFGTPEVNVGLFPMMIAALIFRNAGRKKALEMIYTARMISGAEAEAMGLITRAVPAADLDAVVGETLASIGSKAPLAMEIGRKALAAIEGKDLNSSLDYLCEQFGFLASTEDAMEGVMAFMEKRAPAWKRR
jgi:enoyl-CoA hydratase/carnithine racemase